MLVTGLLAGVEAGLNRVLRLDATALPRLQALSGKVIAVHGSNPAFSFYLLPSGDGLQLAGQWHVDADCSLCAPAASLVRLAVSRDKTSVLHAPEVSLDGDSGVLLQLADILQDLELDWEYELSRWLGPLATPLLAGHLRSRVNLTSSSVASLRQNLADFLAEESRSLVGQREAEARFNELDQLKLALDRLEARIEHLSQRAPDA
ncbi:SCP2 domain-containing protein [Pseudomonas sp. NCCP-436]|uniref:ubiquinone biosynthesis accessory factor UbiJ n=1 Tax=Pseudomonas sp. NCCP-436 TaxID=2842481 RepID=UPI001C80420E|nr:SCP2 sterol-binding domain-containing protein [Pseudomonas sp. NCCP-436]GIZ12771.1 SCP2 domain-containing protein [Pseudomonas sp. NCCP-436]